MANTGSHVGEAAKRRLAGILHRFRKDESGGPASEFALILFPFAALLFAIIETSIIFFTGQALQTAVTDASRLILTGQVQSATVPNGSGGTKPYDLAAFKTDVCNRFPAITDCAGSLMLDVRTYTSFASASVGTPTKVDASGKTVVDPAQMNNWSPGSAGQIVVVRAIFEYPVLVSFLNLANLGDGNRLIMASAAFRNEPFPSSP